MRQYVVIYERGADGGWGAYLPDLPGVVAVGKSRGEVGARIKEALDAYVADLRDRGDSLPAALHDADVISA